MNEYQKAVELAKKMDGMSAPHMIGALAGAIRDVYEIGRAIGRSEGDIREDHLMQQITELRDQVAFLTGQSPKGPADAS